MSKYTDIKDKLKEIVGKGSGILVFTAVVKSVSDDTCTVIYNDIELTGVKLTASVDKLEAKIIISPKINSKVLIADLSNGELRDLFVIKFGEIEVISINSGKSGGLIKINELVDKLNELKDKVNSLVKAFNSHTHQVATAGMATNQTGTAAPIIKKASTANAFAVNDIEDTNVRH
jgi:hypothetical protein